MGIRGLETLISRSDDKFVEDIDIRDEIQKWKAAHDEKRPKIIFDLYGIAKIQAKFDETSHIIGGRYEEYTQTIENFFRDLSDCDVELEFFCNPHIGRMDETYKRIVEAYDCLNALGSAQKVNAYLEKKTTQWNQFELIGNKMCYYNLVKTSANYGTVHTHFGKLNKMGKYAFEHSDEILAVVDHSTDFLIFDGEYQYWGLAGLDLSNLKCKKYHRERLEFEFGLNRTEMQLLAAISRINKDVINRFCRNYPQIGEPKTSKYLYKLANYIRNLEIPKNGIHFEQIASDLFGKYTSANLEEFRKNMSHYDLNTVDEEPENHVTRSNLYLLELVDFCQQKNICFAYALLMKTRITYESLVFIDLRRPDSVQFKDLITKIVLKLCGILFKDVESRPETFTFHIKRHHGDCDNCDGNIIYPEMPLPSITQLIIEEDNELFTDDRWSLLNWVLGLNEDLISKIKMSVEDKHMQLVYITLKLLVSNGIITNYEACAILESESLPPIQSNSYWSIRNYPNRVEFEWIQTAHKYTIAFETVCHCMEICGLRNQTDFIRFDAYKFHQKMDQPEDDHQVMMRHRHHFMMM